MYVRVQVLKDKVGAICKNMGPCVKCEHNREHICWAKRDACDGCPCIEHLRNCGLCG